jgi:hypothetical protein
MEGWRVDGHTFVVRVAICVVRQQRLPGPKWLGKETASLLKDGTMRNAVAMGIVT